MKNLAVILVALAGLAATEAGAHERFAPRHFGYPRHYGYPHSVYPYSAWPLYPRVYPYAYAYPYPYYVAPPPVVVERYYVDPPYEPPPPPPPPRLSERTYAQAAPSAPEPRLERYTLSASELFEFDRTGLKKPQPKLDEIAAAMTRNPQITNVHIIGYTDRLGTDSYNRQLSQRRAQAVKAYLVAKGVAAHRLVAEGKGKANPLVQCDQKERAALIACLAPNRRVEVEQITVERAR